jgi:hypothetical protein
VDSSMFPRVVLRLVTGNLGGAPQTVHYELTGLKICRHLLALPSICVLCYDKHKRAYLGICS